MAWVGFQESGVGSETGQSEGVSLSGSRFSSVGGESNFWAVQFTNSQSVKITAESYNSNPPGDQPAAINIIYASADPQQIVNQGGANSWQPTPIERDDVVAIQYVAAAGESSSFSFLVQVASGQPQAGPCEEIGRATRNYVSAYQRDRVARSSLYASERRCLVTDFNGAIPKGRSIVKAVWQTTDTIQAAMSAPRITGRQVEVTISAQYTGQSRIRVDATLDNGEVYSAWHVVKVMPAPYFNNPGWVTGPQQLVAVSAEEPLP